MKKYRVTIRRDQWADVVVEAESEDAAVEAARVVPLPTAWETIDYDVDEESAEEVQ